MKRAGACLILVLSAVGSAGPALAQVSDVEGEVIADVRVRAEHVDREGLDETLAVTWRARLGYEIKTPDGWSALIEGEAVGHLNDDFSDSIDVVPGKAVVADPEALELNRLQLAWTDKSANATLGRQRIVLDDGRFVGSVGFRQNEQTFDAVRLGYTGGDAINLQYIYIDKVHRIFGDESPVGEFESNSHVLRVAGETDMGNLVATVLLLDLGGSGSASSQTYAVRWSKSWPLGDGILAANIQAAEQSGYEGMGPTVDLGFQSYGATYSSGDITFVGGLEILEGAAGQSFATPLATLHAFQGWADVFLNTPPSGIRDLSVGITGKGSPAISGAEPVSWAAFVHQFESDNGALTHGAEFDAVLRIPINEFLAIETKAAVFSGAAGGPPDTSKFWLALEASF